jgi:hypothetical protein
MDFFYLCRKHAYWLGFSSSSRITDVPAHSNRDSVFAGQQTGNGASVRVLNNSLALDHSFENNQAVSDIPNTETQVATIFLLLTHHDNPFNPSTCIV